MQHKEKDLNERIIWNKNKEINDAIKQRGRPRKQFQNLTEKYKKVLSSRVVKYLNKNYSGVPELIKYISKKLKVRNGKLHKKIQEFCDHYLHSLENKCRVGALLTLDMDLKVASEVSKMTISSLSWGRLNIKNGNFLTLKAYTPVSSKAPEKEKQWLNNLVKEFSPVKSGTLKKKENFVLLAIINFMRNTKKEQH